MSLTTKSAKPGEAPSREPLEGMFISVPPRYDLINRLITLGLDKRWRREAARECLILRPKRVLDLGCGTGDLALILAEMAEEEVELLGIDFSRPMLELARRKAKLKGKRVSFIQGSIRSLPFPDGYFDSIGISFAFRNLSYKNPYFPYYLNELLRVLASGGRLIILETSQPKSKLAKKAYHLYLRLVVSNLGYLISGNRGAYSYLAESATRFFAPDEVEEILYCVGFRKVYFRAFLCGAISIHTAIK